MKSRSLSLLLLAASLAALPGCYLFECICAMPDYFAIENNAGTDLNVGANDKIDREQVTDAVYSLVSQPQHGTLTVVDDVQGIYHYVPQQGFPRAPYQNDVDTFTYRITGTCVDGAGNARTVTSVARVVIQVKAAPQSPVDDTAQTEANTSVEIDVLANDPPGSTIAGVSQPANGSAAVANGQITYTPDSGFSGLDTFTYTTQGGTATVSVEVSASPNNCPVAEDDEIFLTTTAELIPILDNDFDPDGDPLQIVDVTQPQGGGATAINGSQIELTAPQPFDSSVTFQYTISDGRCSDTATVIVWPPAMAQVTLRNNRNFRATFTIATGQLIDCDTGEPLSAIVLEPNAEETVCIEIGTTGTSSQDIEFTVMDDSGFTDTQIFEVRTTEIRIITLTTTGLTIGSGGGGGGGGGGGVIVTRRIIFF